MADISEPALEKALTKVKQLVPSARVETKVRLHFHCPSPPHFAKHTQSPYDLYI